MRAVLLSGFRASGCAETAAAAPSIKAALLCAQTTPSKNRKPARTVDTYKGERAHTYTRLTGLERVRLTLKTTQLDSVLLLLYVPAKNSVVLSFL